MKNLVYITSILVISISLHPMLFASNLKKPSLALSFDDGSIQDMPRYKLEQWNSFILQTFKKYNLKSILFVKGKSLDNSRGRYVLKSWNNSQHWIGNHTYNHPYFHSSKVTLMDFKRELVRNHEFIKNYSNFVKIFRFPYLKEGNTAEKRDGFRKFLKEKGYKNGHVTIDASDWYVNNRLIKRLKEDPKADISGFRDYYLKHIYDRATYYDDLAYKLKGRRIRHTLLLHHNLAAALFLEDLIKHFKKNGWNLLSVDKAYEDTIYTEIPNTLPAGESLIWALAKETGRYDKILRYPAEDGRYEKEAMDREGL